MSTKTEHLSMIKPDITDPISPTPFNQNSDILDGVINDIQNVIGNMGGNPWEKLGSVKFSGTLQHNETYGVDIHCNRTLGEVDELLFEVDPTYISVQSTIVGGTGNSVAGSIFREYTANNVSHDFIRITGITTNDATVVPITMNTKLYAHEVACGRTYSFDTRTQNPRATTIIFRNANPGPGARYDNFYDSETDLLTIAIGAGSSTKMVVNGRFTVYGRKTFVPTV